MLISPHGCGVQSLLINVDYTIIPSTKKKQVHGVKIDDRLNFAEPASDVCTLKADRQINGLQRLK